MTERKKYKTLVLSDIHLGARFSKVAHAIEFLTSVDAEKLIFNGDTIDGWQLKKKGNPFWALEHSNFFKTIMKIMEQQETEIYFLRGNHDDFLDKIIPMIKGKLSILKDMVIESGEKKFFVTHGDIFDNVTSKMGWLAKIGDVMYNVLLVLNYIYNKVLRLFGRPYYSFSKAIKNKVKQAVAKSSGFDKMLVEMARTKGCDGVICGHIHRPEDRMIDGVRYLNSGDWVETMSALAETQDGNWEILYYKDSALVR